MGIAILCCFQKPRRQKTWIFVGFSILILLCVFIYYAVVLQRIKTTCKVLSAEFDYDPIFERLSVRMEVIKDSLVSDL